MGKIRQSQLSLSLTMQSPCLLYPVLHLAQNLMPSGCLTHLVNEYSEWIEKGCGVGVAIRGARAHNRPAARSAVKTAASETPFPPPTMTENILCNK